MFCTIIYCVDAEMSTLMSISDGLGPYFLHPKKEQRGLWGKKWIESCLFPPGVGIFPL